MLDALDRKTARASLLLRTMPDETAEFLLDGAQTQDYADGETIFLQGEPARNVHVVLSGWVKLYRMAPNGNEAVVSVMSKSQSFAEAVALRKANYPVSAEAVTACRLAHLSTAALVDRILRHPELCLSLLSSTFRHLHDLVGQLENLKAQTGSQRVAEFLLDLCTQTSGPCSVTLPYDKLLIAGRLGMKPESLSRVFAKLRTYGVRIEKNEAVIEDIERLREHAEQDRAETRVSGVS